MLFEFKKKEIVHSCQSKAKCVMIKIIVAGASPTDIRMRRLLWQQRKIKDMEMKAFPHSKVRTVSESVRVSSSVLTDWRDANILFLRFSQTRLMKQEKASATESLLLPTATIPSKCRTLDAVFQLTITQKRNGITGSWFSVSCMQAENTTPIRVKAMSFHWDSTDLVPARPSTLPNILMPRFIGMVTVIICILKREKISED